MNFIKQRTDVSEWLIHFVRDRDPENDFPALDEEEYDRLVGSRLAADESAIAVLHDIIDIGALLPGYSFRNGRTTIYGGKPAICFTEAPIYNFVKYVSERDESTRCSHYGICLLKSEVFAAGGRHVIYGLASSTCRLVQDSDWCRIIDPEILPPKEQFRYVAYDPNRQKPLDWTHEREWRWVADDEKRHCIIYNGPDGVNAYDALPLFRPISDGGYFSQVGFLVRTQEEARVLSELLVGYADSGGNDYGEEYAQSLLRTAFVLPLEDVEQLGIQRIEDAPKGLRMVAHRKKASAKLIARVRQSVAEASVAATKAVRKFIAEAKRTEKGLVRDVCGFADVITYDATSDVTDALLKAKLAHASGGQYYAVDVRINTSGEQALCVHEAGARAAADYLQKALNQEFSVKSWRD